MGFLTLAGDKGLRAGNWSEEVSTSKWAGVGVNWPGVRSQRTPVAAAGGGLHPTGAPLKSPSNCFQHCSPEWWRSPIFKQGSFQGILQQPGHASRAKQASHCLEKILCCPENRPYYVRRGGPHSQPGSSESGPGPSCFNIRALFDTREKTKRRGGGTSLQVHS